jgi:hypothetical protein
MPESSDVPLVPWSVDNHLASNEGDWAEPAGPGGSRMTRTDHPLGYVPPAVRPPTVGSRSAAGSRLIRVRRPSTRDEGRRIHVVVGSPGWARGPHRVHPDHDPRRSPGPWSSTGVDDHCRFCDRRDPLSTTTRRRRRCLAAASACVAEALVDEEHLVRTGPNGGRQNDPDWSPPVLCPPSGLGLYVRQAISLLVDEGSKGCKGDGAS